MAKGNRAVTLKTEQAQFTPDEVGNLVLSVGAANPALDFTMQTPLESALLLYQMGLNVFPLIRGEKRTAYKWGRLRTTRLHPTDEEYGLRAVFALPSNVGVMCGRTSGNLFVLDCESPETFEYNKAQLCARNIPVFSVETARGGHIWLRCTTGEVKKISPGVMQDMELRGENGTFVLAPPSIHPSGVIYQYDVRESVTPPEVRPEQIDWLTDKNGNSITLQIYKPQNRAASERLYSPLSRKTQDYLANGSTYPEGERRTALFNAACDACGCKFSPSDAMALLMAPALASGLPQVEAERAIREAYSQPRTPSRKTTQKATFWQRAIAFEQTFQWKSGTGANDRIVFLAFIERAKVGGNQNGTFRASYRELAVFAHTGVKGVRNAIQRLKTAEPAPLICWAGKDKITKSSLWRFSDFVLSRGAFALAKNSDALRLSPLPSGDGAVLSQFDFVNREYCEGGAIRKRDTLWSTHKGLSSSVSVLRKTDALERGALGACGILIHSYLCTSRTPVRVSEIIKDTHLSKHQVYNALRPDGWLRKSSLVEKVGSGWIGHAATDEELDERVARQAGKLGRGARREAQFAEERALYIGRTIVLTQKHKEPKPHNSN